MVMPFRTKPVVGARTGAPASVDFDRLWDLAYRPALEELGYRPVRADLDNGSVIVKDMLNRLRHAHVVLADVSLQNGNVYYEVGVRHVARQRRCVLLAADWSKQLFDIDQFTTLRYPLADGRVTAAAADAIRQLLVRRVPDLSTAKTPYHVLVDPDVEGAFVDEARALGELQSRVGAIRLVGSRSERLRLAAELIGDQTDASLQVSEVALELIFLLRDDKQWARLKEFVERLPAPVREIETVREQYLLAISELGAIEEAITGLESLIRESGPTPERFGLLGGRYKRLYRRERDARLAEGEDEATARERKWLGRAIDHYRQGMELDLNEYYCSCNLPALLRARGEDEEADAIEPQVVAATARALKRGVVDEFLPGTLFGIAFRKGDAASLRELESLADELETGSRFALGTALEDAGTWIDQAPPAAREKLRSILGRLKRAYESED
jgi:hypothetical protein